MSTSTLIPPEARILPSSVAPSCPDSGIPAGSTTDVRWATPMLDGLTIVLPCFDEAGNVADAIRQAAAAAAGCSHEYEIVIVDDGSGDETSEIAAAFAAADRRVRLIIHQSNRGYGAALRSGIEAARMPWVLLTDADLQFDLRELEDFVEIAQRADAVVGWRILRQDPVHRRLNAAAWNRLVRALFHLPVRDVDCAFKLVRRGLLADVAIHSAGAMISTELMVRLLAAGARVEEIGVHHRPRATGRQSGANPRVVGRAFRELLALRRQLHALAPPVAV